jgi:predicted metal-dependent TIM-barrel fold hydrolase
VRKILITHPEHAPVEMAPDVQRELVRNYDVLFERCFISTTFAGGELPFGRLASIIREVGFESTVISTDLGQVGNPDPVDGFARYIAELSKAGFSENEVRRMAAANPSALLGVE